MVWCEGLEASLVNGVFCPYLTGGVFSEEEVTEDTRLKSAGGKRNNDTLSEAVFALVKYLDRYSPMTDLQVLCSLAGGRKAGVMDAPVGLLGKKEKKNKDSSGKSPLAAFDNLSAKGKAALIQFAMRNREGYNEESKAIFQEQRTNRYEAAKRKAGVFAVVMGGGCCGVGRRASWGLGWRRSWHGLHWWWPGYGSPTVAPCAPYTPPQRRLGRKLLSNLSKETNLF